MKRTSGIGFLLPAGVGSQHNVYGEYKSLLLVFYPIIDKKG